MSDRIPALIWDRLACPACGAVLEPRESGARCPGCAERYTGNGAAALDLRPRSARRRTVEIDLAAPPAAEDAAIFDVLAAHPSPEVDFETAEIPHHLTAAMLSHFPRAGRPGALALDLGCGKAIHRPVCERAGFAYVGLDYDSPGAPLLGDAHALPFVDDTFDFILSVAVLEHVRHPLIVMEEAFRVLRPGGKLLGTVAFLEPYHARSVFHHTHLGVHEVLSHAGFRIEAIAPSRDWTVLTATAKALFCHMPRRMGRLVVSPLELAHRLWWRLRGPGERERLLRTTGAFTFVAWKPS